MGGTLATAVGTAADEMDGVAQVEKLMVEDGVDAKLAKTHAPDIYKAVKEFMENTEFRFKPGPNY